MPSGRFQFDAGPSVFATHLVDRPLPLLHRRELVTQQKIPPARDPTEATQRGGYVQLGYAVVRRDPQSEFGRGSAVSPDERAEGVRDHLG
jgi:hypothetical protein